MPNTQSKTSEGKISETLRSLGSIGVLDISVQAIRPSDTESYKNILSGDLDNVSFTLLCLVQDRVSGCAESNTLEIDGDSDLYWIMRDIFAGGTPKHWDHMPEDWLWSRIRNKINYHMPWSAAKDYMFRNIDSLLDENTIDTIERLSSFSQKHQDYTVFCFAFGNRMLSESEDHLERYVAKILGKNWIRAYDSDEDYMKCFSDPMFRGMWNERKTRETLSWAQEDT